MIGSFAIKCTPNLRWEFNIIRVRVNGGLGNQLFKFFHGLKTALKYNKNLFPSLVKFFYLHGNILKSSSNQYSTSSSFFNKANLSHLHDTCVIKFLGSFVK